MYVSVCRGLFEKDKMVFAATVAVSDFPQCVHPHGHSFVLRRRTSFNLLQRSFNVLSIFFQLVGGSFILVSINILVEHFKTTARVDSGGMERLVGHSFPHRAGRVVDPGTTGRTTGRGEPKGRTLVDK